MYSVNKVIEKLNNNYVANGLGLSINGEKIEEPLTLSDFMKCSLSEINEIASNTLTCDEKEFLYQQAQKEKHNNTKEKVNILRRANPQIGDKVSLGINLSPNQTSYDRLFGNNAVVNVDPKSVASQFSAASYLKELYLHAVGLHKKDSIYNIDNRRPDIEDIKLSQENLEKEVSVLSLSNSVIKEKIKIDNDFNNEDDLMEKIYNDKHPGCSMFNLPFESVKNSLSLQDVGGKALDNYIFHNLNKYDERRVLLLKSGINPGVQRIIDEEASSPKLTSDYSSNLENKKNPAIEYLSKHYNIEAQELTSLLKGVDEEYYKKLSCKDTSASVSPYRDMLSIDKSTLLYKSTGMSISDFTLFQDSVETVDKDGLTIYATARHFMGLYKVDFSKALIMSGGKLNPKCSYFDMLFNTPLINNNKFKVSENLKPLDEHGNNSLKRAFDINIDELNLILKYADSSDNHDGQYKINIVLLSKLYRIKLFSDAHCLNVEDYISLMKIIDENQKFDKNNDFYLMDNRFNDILNLVKNYSLSIPMLHLMTSEEVKITQECAIDDVLTSIYNAIMDKNLTNLSTKKTLYIKTLSNIVADAIGVKSLDVVEAIIEECNFESLTNHVNQLIKHINANNAQSHINANNAQSSEQSKNLFSFYTKIAKLVFTVTSLKLLTCEIKYFIQNYFFEDTGSISLDKLLSISRVKEFLAQCGNHADEVINKLNNKKLTKKDLEGISDIKGVVSAIEGNKPLEWKQIDDGVNKNTLVNTLSLSPKDLEPLLALFEKNSDYSYVKWSSCKDILEASLNKKQLENHNEYMDEITSSALCEYTLSPGKGKYPSEVNDRNSLYEFLLLDNQDSAKIKTTRIASTISGLQLYINTSLGKEDADIGVKNRKFFKDWDSFNKRYSDWQGKELLTYYPENYVDPTIRIGQTKMMDEMLQSISQNQITDDTVSDAFNTYMTKFDEIANLQVISGYHDSTDHTVGSTYIIGKSSSGTYFWRKCDIDELFIEGKLAANSWTDWEKISLSTPTISDFIRPVIFRGRLNVVWIEEGSKNTKSASQGVEVKKIYSLNYSHIEHDGTWSAPIKIKLNIEKIDDSMGFYCSEAIEEYGKGDELYCLTYLLNRDGDTVNNRDGGKVNKREKLIVIGDGYTKDECVTENYIQEVKSQLKKSKLGDILISSPYPRDYIVVAKRANMEYIKTDSFTIYDDSLKFSVYKERDNTEITFEPSFRVRENLDLYTKDEKTKKLINYLIGKDDIDFDSFYTTEFNDENTGDHFRVVIVVKGEECTPYIYSGLISGNDGKEFTIDFYINNIGEESELHDIISVDDYSIYKYSPLGINELSVNDCSFYVDYEEDIPSQEIHLIGHMHSKGKSDLCLGQKQVTISYSYVGLGQSYSISKSINADELKGDYFSPKSTLTISNVHIHTSNSKLRLVVRIGEVDYCEKSISINKGLLKSLPIIRLVTYNKAQYMETRAYRVRLNTLFSKELVKQAKNGISNILSIKTQQMKEPMLGEGVLVHLELEKYNKKVHGKNKKFRILHYDLFNSGDHFVILEGELSEESSTSFNLFVPKIKTGYGDESHVYITAEYSNGITTTLLGFEETSDGNWKVMASYQSFSGLKNKSILHSIDEPMDFSGANAIYFWEMFYYVPMMVFKRLLVAGHLKEAMKWIKYVYNPNGYPQQIDGATHQWNVLPLIDDTGFHSNPPGDITDPDVIAQSQPIHYKYATIMAMLELLIAHGDACFRVYERDSLNEAKLWYLQALNILGEENTCDQPKKWDNPTLGRAINTNDNLAMLAIRNLTDVNYANSTVEKVVNTFVIPRNEKIIAYRQTLDSRLFNLRHGLSIDGQPLSLPIYAEAKNPKDLLARSVANSQGGQVLPVNNIRPIYHFPQMLDSAKNITNQLCQFGSKLLSIIERQDSEALSMLMHTQGAEMLRLSSEQQKNNVIEIEAELDALKYSRKGAQTRIDFYDKQYQENISPAEKSAMQSRLKSSIAAATSSISMGVAAGLDMVPNIYGLADGGAQYGAVARAIGIETELLATISRLKAEDTQQSEMYRRRRDEWELQLNMAKTDLSQIESQIKAKQIRYDSTILQKKYQETLQGQMQTQLAFLQSKFSNKELYNWLRGSLASIYHQLFDVAAASCLMAQKALHWTIPTTEKTKYIHSDVWSGGAHAGLLAGENLLLGLAQMEQSYQEKSQREKEITKTVSLSKYFEDRQLAKDYIATKLKELIDSSSDTSFVKAVPNEGLVLDNDSLTMTLKLSDLNIKNDYPDELGKTRRIKQISVTLPALIGPYQDIRAMLQYDKPSTLPRGCDAIAVSHGMNDSGQFQLNFGDNRRLPFEGISVEDAGDFILTFPNAKTNTEQKKMLLSLTDVIFHIRYTIALDA